MLELEDATQEAWARLDEASRAHVKWATVQAIRDCTSEDAAAKAARVCAQIAILEYNAGHWKKLPGILAVMLCERVDAPVMLGALLVLKAMYSHQSPVERAKDQDRLDKELIQCMNSIRFCLSAQVRKRRRENRSMLNTDLMHG